MLNLQRKYMDVEMESRGNPRIEFHFPVTIIGFDAQAKVVDFSLSGFYIETNAATLMNEGNKINLALKLPDELTFMTLKAEVVHIDEVGFGCKFFDLSSEKRNTLRRSFSIYSEMLPVE